jgi:hypothetical protein
MQQRLLSVFRDYLANMSVFHAYNATPTFLTGNPSPHLGLFPPFHFAVGLQSTMNFGKRDETNSLKSI